jgi:hypothetical protein
MRKLEDEYSPEEIQQLRDTMDQLRQSQLEIKKQAQKAYEEMKRLDPEFWKAFKFASEHDLIKP